MDSKVVKQILADWAATHVIPAAQRNIGATQSVQETNSRGTKTRKRRRVATGKLKSNLTFFIKKGREFQILFTAKADVSQYAKVIEWGRRPNSKQPPTAAIRKWMDQKGVRLQKEGGGFIKETPGARDAAAYMIARKIGKYGFQGIHYMRDAVQDKAPLLVEDFTRYIADSFSNLDD